MSTIKFKNWVCDIELGKYANGRLAITLVSAENGHDLFKGEPIATATVNVPDIDIKPDQVIIKDYSENQGMLKLLQENNLVGENAKAHKTGFVEVFVVDKTDILKQMENLKFDDVKNIKKNKMH